MGTPAGFSMFTLQGGGHPYRIMVETSGCRRIDDMLSLSRAIRGTMTL